MSSELPDTGTSTTGEEGMARETGTGVTAGISAATVGGTAGMVVGVVIGSLTGFLAGMLLGNALGEKSGFWLAQGRHRGPRAKRG